MALIGYKCFNAAYLERKLYLLNYNNECVHTSGMTVYITALHKANFAVIHVRNTRNLHETRRRNSSHAGRSMDVQRSCERTSNGRPSDVRRNLIGSPLDAPMSTKRTFDGRSCIIWICFLVNFSTVMYMVFCVMLCNLSFFESIAEICSWEMSL